MTRLHKYTLRLAGERGTRVSYSQALASLVEALPDKALGERSTKRKASASRH